MSPEQPRVQKIAVFGLGKLGACIAGTLASRGFEVIGLDVDSRKVEAVKRGVPPIEEPHLQETFRAAGSRLKATADPREALIDADAVFFVPSTPSLPDGSFSNHYLIQAIESASMAARPEDHWRPLIVVNSTLTPGTSDRVLKPLLEKMFRGECGKDFGLCYNPEFIALGDVVRGLLQPDFVLIGESDPLSGELLEEVYRRLCTNSPPIERMSNINAELAKISLNCAVTMKISFVNQLSGVCAKIPGADSGVILKAIGKDRRIGLDYLKPGLGFGGPCFPRDNRLFQYVAQSVGVEAALSHATDKINEDVNRRLLETVLELTPQGGTAGVLGLAYKPNTAVVDQSPGIWLCEQLAATGRCVFAHDYLVGSNALATMPHNRIRMFRDPMEIVKNGCHILIITCPSPGYKELFESRMLELSNEGLVVVDPWRLLEPLDPRSGNLRYINNLGASGARPLPELAAHV